VPAAAASALSPMATRMPLMAMTAVHALCRMAKRIPDQFNNFKRVESGSVRSASSVALCGAALPGVRVVTETILAKDEFCVQSDLDAWAAILRPVDS
jgi:hypothetical protein